MRSRPLSEHPYPVRVLIANVLQANQVDPQAARVVDDQPLLLLDLPGILAVVETQERGMLGVINAPVLVPAEHGLDLSTGEFFQLIANLPGVPHSQFALADTAAYFTQCEPLPDFQPEASWNQLQLQLDLVRDVRLNLLNQTSLLHDEAVDDADPIIARVHLPEVKMTPSEMKVIRRVLEPCGPLAQRSFLYWMKEGWKRGLTVSATSLSITLEIPFGKRSVRLAMLMPEVTRQYAAVNPGLKAGPARLLLMWDLLRRWGAFAPAEIDAYQAAIRKIVQPEITGSAASILLDQKFSRAAMRAVLKEMAAFAAKILPAPAAPLPAVKSPGTSGNIAATLRACDAHAARIFSYLVEQWQVENGVIQSVRPGRIYLKMVTQPHFDGRISWTGHRFTLAALAAPRKNDPASITISWDLGSRSDFAYLDSMPEEIAWFEDQVQSLPGFEQKGCVTRLVVDDRFQIEHAAALIHTMLQLKWIEAVA